MVCPEITIGTEDSPPERVTLIPQDGGNLLFAVATGSGEGTLGLLDLSEELMISRDLALLEYYGGKLHFANISSEASLAMIKSAKRRGLNVTCDVAAHQLLLDDGELLDFDTNYKVNPPLRGRKTIKALMNGLKEGTIDILVSDHRPEDEEGKKLEFDLAAFGMLGIQEMGSMVHEISKQVDLDLIIDKLTYQPRRLLGLEIPSITIGEKAVLTLFDPYKKWTFNQNTNQSKSRNSPNYGKELQGKAVAVFNNSKVLLDKDLKIS